VDFVVAATTQFVVAKLGIGTRLVEHGVGELVGVLVVPKVVVFRDANFARREVGQAEVGSIPWVVVVQQVRLAAIRFVASSMLVGHV
jgi:hypothetical protein